MSGPPLPQLIVITDWRRPRTQLLAALSAVRPLGARIAIQHRAPELTARRFFEEARVLRDLLGPDGPPLFINGRIDVALAVGAHLHLPGDGLPATEVRAHLPADRRISVAVHAGRLDRAVGADLALVSPVFAPGSKPGDTRPTLGPQGFLKLADALPIPAFALGGISPQSLAQLPGAAGAATVSGVLEAASPLASAMALLAVIDELDRRRGGKLAGPPVERPT